MYPYRMPVPGRVVRRLRLHPIRAPGVLTVGVKGLPLARRDAHKLRAVPPALLGVAAAVVRPEPAEVGLNVPCSDGRGGKEKEEKRVQIIGIHNCYLCRLCMPYPCMTHWLVPMCEHSGSTSAGAV